jgi:group II intron reverse transcriptase/maturase
MAFTTLSHHMDVTFLKEAYRRTRKDGATGVDGQTAAEYGANLDGNLQSLLDRAKSGTYRAPAVRRVRIPKGDGKETRPIGIPTFEDKVLQRAVAMLLEAVYEQDFLECSYGFRPGRSAHLALQAIWKNEMDMGGGWVIEVDIRRFFDTLDHGHVREILSQRVRDGDVTRLIGKWLNAGILESGELTYPEEGTPQGGVISPLLANVYLHHVLDEWWEKDVKPRMRGKAFLVRYADDFVMGFEHKQDAERVMDVLPKRFGRFGLELHPEKTRMLEFLPPERAERERDDRQPRTFDFLGFTHYWGRSLKGNWVVKRKTAAKRFSRTLKRMNQWLRKVRHEPVAWQHGRLSKALAGHYSYFGITGNGQALKRLRDEVKRLWHKWLNRRSWRARMTWERFARLHERYPLPPIRVVHSIYRVASP